MCPSRKNHSGEETAFSCQQRNLIKPVALLGNPKKLAHICAPYMHHQCHFCTWGTTSSWHLPQKQSVMICSVLSWTDTSPGLMDNLDVTAATTEEAEGAGRGGSGGNGGVTDPLTPQIHIHKPNPGKLLTLQFVLEKPSQPKARVFSEGASKVRFQTRVIPDPHRNGQFWKGSRSSGTGASRDPCVSSGLQK